MDPMALCDVTGVSRDDNRLILASSAQANGRKPTTSSSEPTPDTRDGRELHKYKKFKLLSSLQSNNQSNASDSHSPVELAMPF